MNHNFGNSTITEHRNGWKLGIRMGLVLTTLASGAMLATSASAAIAAPASAVTVATDDDSGNIPRKSFQNSQVNSKRNLTYYSPHTIMPPKDPFPPVCDKKPYLPNCPLGTVIP
ncbi:MULTISPECIES: hypothetical protein [unclassified Streptomyces]|uniref:hypothetical protein n=1 Tax=unclassified Streptomyces TaxID=2593676 RepID=UPI003435B98D